MSDAAGGILTKTSFLVKVVAKFTPTAAIFARFTAPFTVLYLTVVAYRVPFHGLVICAHNGIQEQVARDT